MIRWLDRLTAPLDTDNTYTHSLAHSIHSSTFKRTRAYTHWGTQTHRHIHNIQWAHGKWFGIKARTVLWNKMYNTNKARYLCWLATHLFTVCARLLHIILCSNIVGSNISFSHSPVFVWVLRHKRRAKSARLDDSCWRNVFCRFYHFFGRYFEAMIFAHESNSIANMSSGVCTL